MSLLAAGLALAGAAMVLVGAVGLLRMPDLYTRMHAAAKAPTLGVSAILLAVALAAGEVGVAVRAALVALFLVLTAPVAAHVVARSAARGSAGRPDDERDQGSSP